MQIRKLGIIAIAGALALSAAACGGDDTGSGAAGGSTEAAAPKTLTYWASNQGTSLDNDKQVLQPELDKFEKQTGIKVNLEVVPWADLLNRILAATTSGQGPDVLNIGNTWSASLQATGAFSRGTTRFGRGRRQGALPRPEPGRHRRRGARPPPRSRSTG